MGVRGGRRAWLLCYDIADPRRLQRVHRFVVQRGLRIQYSVYLVDMDRTAFLRMLEGLSRLVHHRCDDVRLYPVPRRCLAETLGQPLLHSGITLLGTRFPEAFMLRVAGTQMAARPPG